MKENRGRKRAVLIVGALVLTRIPMSQREDAAATPGLAAQKGH